jgi:hypothetical protein
VRGIEPPGKRKNGMDLIALTLITGAGATALADLWGLLRKRLLGVPAPDYAYVGRWIGHMRHGRFRHEAIARAAPIRFEAIVGWTAHYLIGIAYAGLLPVFCGRDWFCAPTPAPALAIGLGTVFAPFLLMQPGMGAGLFARRTPRPALARLHSLAMHAVFGAGIYLSALALHPACAA